MKARAIVLEFSVLSYLISYLNLGQIIVGTCLQSLVANLEMLLTFYRVEVLVWVGSLWDQEPVSWPLW